MEKFDSLKISNPILNALADAGFEQPTSIQQEVLPVVRSGRDVIGIAQTGTGKTLAYLIPILMKLHYAQGQHPRALVVVPTRELVVQVCESVELLTEYMDIRCVGVYGGTNIRTQQQRVYQGVDLLVATPGRLMDIYMNGILRTKLIKTIVVDEADRLMDLGFLPQLRSIMELLPEKHQTLLFSATFSDAVDHLSAEFLINPVRVEVDPQATPVELVEQFYFSVPNISTKINLLKTLLADKQIYKKVMIFTETKKNADRIVERLADYWKDELSVIHSNKAQNTRLNALQSFKTGISRIMVASDVAARGIDILDVTHVINFDIPEMAEEYIHRIGRTARAGKKGTALSFVTESEMERWHEIEKLIGSPIQQLPMLPQVEISQMLLEEERAEVRNINYQQGGGGPSGGGAFHARKQKNSYTAADNRRNVKAKRMAKKKKK